MKDAKLEILHFWFDECEPQQWFTSDPNFDEEIRDRFGLSYDMACEGLSDNWAQDADGALALCLLLSKFPRHMFQDTARMFATDETALAIAEHAIAKDFDQALPPEKRLFLYLPFMFTESATAQKRSLVLFESIAVEEPAAFKQAQDHHATFQKFGRFPERNTILGRESSQEEKEFLKKTAMK